MDVAGITYDSFDAEIVEFSNTDVRKRKNLVNPVDANRRRAKHSGSERETTSFQRGWPSVNNLKYFVSLNARV